MANKRNKYEREIMLPLTFIKIYFVIYCVVNYVMPVYTTGRGGSKIYNYVAVIVMLIGVLGAHGIGSQTVPLAPIGVLRTLQFILLNLIGETHSLRLVPFFILIFCDIFLCVTLMLDRSSYQYIEESEEDEEEEE